MNSLLPALLAAIGALAMASGLAVAASPSGEHPAPAPVLGFDLLRQPTTLADLPLAQRRIVRKALGERRARDLRTGEVKFSAGKISAVGNDAVVCLFSGIESYGAGACAPRRAALRGGITFLLFCAGRFGDRARITGIVPNGVAAVRLERVDDGSLIREAKVVSNAFTMIVPPVEAIKIWVGRRLGVTRPIPLEKLAGESECPIRSEEL